MTTDELIAHLNLKSRGAFYMMRHRGEGPPAVKVQKALLFRREDVDAWLATKVQTSFATARGGL